MKRLLISIPSKPNGAYAVELSWWLTAINVESSILDFAAVMSESSPNLSERLMIRKAAEKFVAGWRMEQATLQWQDPRKATDLGKPMIPPGWSVATTPVFGGPIAANRNEQGRRFLFHSFDDKLEPTDFDAVLFMDDDNVIGRHDLWPLLEDIERDDVDVVGGVYCMEAPEGPQPLVYKLDEDGKGFDYDHTTLIKPIGLHKLEGGGLPGGCLLIKRHVFEKMWEARRVWFKDRLHDCSFEYHEIHSWIHEFKDDPEGFYKKVFDEANKRGDDWTLPAIGSWHIGEDIWFCRMCIEMGIDLWCDTRVFAKHYKTRDNKQTFLRQQKIGREFFHFGVEATKPDATPEERDAIYRDFVRDRVASRKKAKEEAA